VVTTVMLVLQGCVSVQLPGENGRPHIIGFGRAKPVPVKKGEIYRIIAPGLSLRLHSFAPGLSLGWSETDLFYPESGGQTNQPCTPAAVRTRYIGINLAPWQAMAGFDRSFAICPPPENKAGGTTQLVLYSENNETNTIIERKEKP